MAYWDTSCLLKLYVPEPDSDHFEAHVLAGAGIVTSEIARLELHAALQRKEAAGDLHVGEAREALAAYDSDVARGLVTVRSLGPAVVTQFEAIIERCCHHTPMLPLRTLDAIHLATAVNSGESELVATDRRLRAAAIELGLSVYPAPRPNVRRECQGGRIGFSFHFVPGIHRWRSLTTSVSSARMSAIAS